MASDSLILQARHRRGKKLLFMMYGKYAGRVTVQAVIKHRRSIRLFLAFNGLPDKAVVKLPIELMEKLLRALRDAEGPLTLHHNDWEIIKKGELPLRSSDAHSQDHKTPGKKSEEKKRR